MMGNRITAWLPGKCRLTVADRFGWTNASYLYGLSFMSLHAKRALGVNADYKTFAKAKSKATQV